MNLAPRPLFASHISSPRSVGISLHGGAPTQYGYQGPTAIITKPSPPVSTVGTPSSPQLPIGVPRANPANPTRPIINNGSGLVTNFSGTGGSFGTPVAAPVRISPRVVGAGLFA